MKVPIFEAHDRLKYLIQNQASVISQGCEDCLKRNPDSLRYQEKSPYVYIFAHPRKHDNGRDTRLIWQARLTKPKAQTNSYLFRAESHSDNIELCWFLPPREQWAQYKIGNVTESRDVLWSIDMFENHREKLEAPFPDDLSEEQARNILITVCMEIESQKAHAKLYENLYGG